MDTAKILADVEIAEKHPVKGTCYLPGERWESSTTTLAQHCRDLLAENAKLRESLAPFAETYERSKAAFAFAVATGDPHLIATAANFRRAAELLAAKPTDTTVGGEG